MGKAYAKNPAETDTGGPIRLAPVGRETLQDRVYNELRRALIAGLFAPAQVLTIQGLADSLATSTMPVREALGRLISEKALEAMPNRSVRVPPITEERLDDLLRVRTLIEGEATALAAPRLTRQDLNHLKDLLGEWDHGRNASKAMPLDRQLELNQAFHFCIYRAAGSAVLLPMIESLWLQCGPCTRAATIAFAEAGERDTERYHLDLVEALEAGDSEAARTALVADISRPFAFLRNKRTAAATS